VEKLFWLIVAIIFFLSLTVFISVWSAYGSYVSKLGAAAGNAKIVPTGY